MVVQCRHHFHLLKKQDNIIGKQSTCICKVCMNSKAVKKDMNDIFDA